MAEKSYEKDGSESMVVLHLNPEDVLDSYEKGVLQNNPIGGVITPSFTQRDLDQYLRYPITSLTSMRLFLGRDFKRDNLLHLLISLVEALYNAEAYALSAKRFAMDLDSVFVHAGTLNVELVYVPIKGYQNEGSFRSLVMELLTNVRYDLFENCSYVAGIITLLNRDPVPDYETILVELRKMAAESPAHRETPHPVTESLKYASAPARGITDVPESVSAGASHEENKPKVSQNQMQYAEQKKEYPPDDPVTVKVQPEIFVNLDADTGKVVKEKPLLFPQSPLPQQGKSKRRFHLFGKRKEKASPNQPEAVPVQPAPQLEQASEPSGVSAKERTAAGSDIGFAIPGKTIPPVMPPVNGAKSTEQTAPHMQNMPDAKQAAAAPPVRKAEDGMSVYFGSAGQGEFNNSTVIIGGGDGYQPTVKLGDAVDEKKPDSEGFAIVKLERKQTGQTMMITKDRYLIGSAADVVDFWINGNPAIGGIHAIICHRGNQFFLSDNNSQNGTFLDGKAVPAGAQEPLKDQDTIRLANEEFVFCLERH